MTKNNSEKTESQIIDSIILNLKIISEIKKKDKLSIINNIVSIDKPGPLQGIKRWYSNSNRLSSIEKIESIISKSIKITKDKINKIKNKTEGNRQYFEEDTSKFFHRLSYNLTNSIKGLNNLKLTYLNDISIKTRLDLIISKIQKHTEEIESILKIKLD
tara:strand:+ start:158 stop:634 length:477 start_codon:yes stop_codon:yes gene_type:complete